MLDTIFNILKVTVIIGVCAIFMVAITGLLNLITAVFFHSVVGEILALVSMYLPFDAGAVFSAIGTSCVAILTFLIAKKIFDLTSWGVSAV